jgi:hypothetical protein
MRLAMPLFDEYLTLPRYRAELGFREAVKETAPETRKSGE